MNPKSRITRWLGTVLLLGGALLTAAPSAAAATEEATPQAEAAAELLPPTLTEATLPTGDDIVHLFWEPSATALDTRFYNIYADGRFVLQVDAIQNGGSIRGCAVFLKGGATRDAEYTVVAEDAAGNLSAPSNGLVPVNLVPLPKPTVTSAVITGDNITITWEPTVTEAESVTYDILVNGDWGFAAVTDATSITSARSIVIDDPFFGRRTFTINEGNRITVSARDSDGFRSPASDPFPVTLR